MVIHVVRVCPELTWTKKEYVSCPVRVSVQDCSQLTSVVVNVRRRIFPEAIRKIWGGCVRVISGTGVFIDGERTTQGFAIYLGKVVLRCVCSVTK